jgi:hypothetical protein
VEGVGEPDLKPVLVDVYGYSRRGCSTFP